MDALLNVAIVLALVLVNGFFVAAEFALVAARRTRIDELAERGSAAARTVQRAMSDPNRFISAAQVGITIASLLLGAVGEPALSALLEPAFESVLPARLAFVSSHAVSFVLALAIITYLHIVLGEQVPKMLALQRAESTILFTSLLTQRLATLFRPLIALLYWGTEVVLRALGLRWEGEHSLVYTEDELKRLVTASTEQGMLETTEEQMINRVFSFTDMVATQVMVPRTEMSTIPITISLPELAEMAVQDGHTRFPVHDGTIDNIVGVVHTKDLVRVLANRRNGRFTVRQILRDVLTVPETMPVTDLMAEMQRRRTHMAIVVDEYGGTAGLVTLEDLLERIIGDVQDEFQVEEPDIERLENGDALINGLMSVEEFNDAFDLELEDEDYNTLGGIVFGHLGRRPEVGDEVQIDSMRLRVEAMDGVRIARLRMTPLRSGRLGDGASEPSDSE